MRNSSGFQSKYQLSEMPRRLPQSTRIQPANYESEDDDSVCEMDADQKIVAVSDFFSAKRSIWDLCHTGPKQDPGGTASVPHSHQRVCDPLFP